jgi:iron complex outermembrane recepter protein
MTKRIADQRRIFVLCCIVCSLAAASSRASGADGAADQSAGLEEIVVSAQRVEQSVDKVPISITALSQKTMDDLHIEKLADLASYVPGLYVTPANANGQDISNVAIRGIYSYQNAPTTQFYIDETPIAIRQLPIGVNSMSPQPMIFDLDRVEVLRGPQGTLFGASAMGGAIRFITPQPSLNDSSGFVKADVGDTDGGSPSYEVGAAYGAPIVQGTLGFRMSAWYQSTGGFIDQEDPFTGEILKKNANTSEAYVFRPAVTWAPSDDLTITPAAYLQYKHSENNNAYWLNSLANTEDGNHVWGGTLQPLTDDLRVGSLAIKYNVAGLAIQSDTSYLDRELQESTDITQIEQYLLSGTSFIPGTESFHANQTDISSNHAWQEEFRVSSEDPSSRLNWVAGAFYRHSVVSLEQLWPPDLTPLTEACCQLTSLQLFSSPQYPNGIPNYVVNGQSLNAYTTGHTTDISEAVFGDITSNLTSRLKANVGARIEHLIVQDQNEVFAGPFDGVPYMSTNLPDVKSTPVTPRASLTYQYTDDDMVYATAAKGFRPGGGNVLVGDSPLCAKSLNALGYSSVPASFGSDRLWSYEIGAKDLLFERRLSVEASAYYIDWSEVQTALDLPSCGQSFTTNRGKAISQGFDLQAAAAVTDDLKLRALVGYTDAYYPNASYGAPLAGGVAPVLNGAGDKVVPVIPWTFAVNGEYSHDISALWAESRGYFRVDYRHLSATTASDPRIANYDPQGNQAHPDPAYGVLNVRMGVVHGGWDLSTYVNNATNADPMLAYLHAGYGDPLYRASAIQPLTAGLTAWYKF